MDVSHWLDAIRTDGAAVAATPSEYFGLAIPSCPDWTGRDLIVHLGAVHRWAARFLTQDPDSRERFGFDTSDVPGDDALTEWYAARLADLLTALDGVDAAAPVRSFTGAVTAEFWFRRQAHETSVHRWDLLNAMPAGASAIEAGLAADGVDEWQTVFAPRFLGRGEGLPQAVRGTVIGLRPTDADQRTWRLDERAVSVEAGAEPDVVVSGSASDLMLGLWRRIPLSQLSIDGDVGAVRALLDAVRVT